jgi:predicted RNA-binding protein with RPS1 domain
MHRQPLDAKNVLVIDAVGPRTSAVVVVDSEDRVLHSEDVPCQLTKAMRQQLVTRLGELVHQHHVDLIIVSNGPARRGVMVAITELLAQSQGSPLRWTLAERAGAEVYAGGPEGNRELRSLPRRFRAAVWLAQLVRSPARALAKVEVSKLRLGSYQRELAERSLAGALRDVVTSGVCQISVDANGADRGWLSSLPGVNESVAEAIDKRRRDSLFDSRAALLALNHWPDAVAQRQAIPFLRVFGGNQPLDATPIHPDDYGLAEKLMARLEIPAPPAAPPGYEPPDYHAEPPKAEVATPEPTATGFVEVKINPVDPDAPFGELPGNGEDEVVAGDGILDSTVSSDLTPGLEGVPAEAELSVDAAATEQAPATTEQVVEPKPVEPKPVYEPYRVELPAADKLARCAKEWQVGEHRVQQIVRALCDPFGMQQVEMSGPTAAMPMVPKLTELKPGDLVGGVVVGIAGFGVFVELGPECSGLIHVSRVSEDFVEDLNEFLQIGDVINAWVVEIDSKRRRVSLSGISPERQEAVRQQKREWSESAKPSDRPNRGNRDNRGGRGQGSSEAPRPNASRGNAEGTTGERRAERSQDRNQNRGNRDGRSDGARPSGRPQADAASGRGKNSSGGRRENRDSRDSGSRGTKSYTAVSRTNAPVAKLTEGMKSGSEPLRSFGDLMQFFKDARQSNDPTAEASGDTQSAAAESTSQSPREDRDTIATIPPVDQSPSDGNAESSVPPADPTA